MKGNQRDTRKKLPYGPNIVRAWFDTTFRYTFGHLSTERSFLARMDWTYRFHFRALAYIEPLAERMPGSARENLEQFLMFFPEVEALIGEHDRCARRLAEGCEAHHAAIMESSSFLHVFETVKLKALAAPGSGFSTPFGELGTKERLAETFAEYLVNNIGELPEVYSIAPLWNAVRDQFVQAIDEPNLTAFRRKTDAFGQALRESVDRLTDKLKATRSELSLEFDVPFAAEMTSAH